MTMYFLHCIRFTGLLVIVAGSFLVTGCTKEQKPAEPPKKVVMGHGNVPVTVTPEKNPVPGTVLAMKNTRLEHFPQRSVGEAFDGYRHFDTKEWRETRGEGGKVYVDFIGLKKVGLSFDSADKDIVSRGVEVKFVIYFSGQNGVAMVTRLDVMADGRVNRYPLEDKRKVLDAIYNNREIAY